MQLIDTHCHLDFSVFDDDRYQVINRANQQGVIASITPSIGKSNWQQVKELCNQHNNLFPAYGLHPMFMQEHKNKHLNELDHWLSQNSAIAIGECGLDFFPGSTSFEAQKTIFQGHIDLAQQYQLPLIIHARKSVEDVILMLKPHQGISGVCHSFSGSYQQAKRLIDMGFYLGFGGPATYSRATKLQKLLKQLPLDSIVLESDAPDQPDSSHHGKRNEPAFLLNINNQLSRIIGVSAEKLAEVSCQNAIRVFGLTNQIIIE